MSSGGGGGSSGVKYDNLENLYGTQQQAAQFMLDQAMPNIATTLGNSGKMVGDAQSGALAEQMRGRASYDANEAITSSNNDSIRKLTSFGAVGDPSSGRFSDTVNHNAISGAKVRAGAMNQANTWAEDQKWNRNAGLYAQASGTGSGAMSGMSGAGAGLSNINAQQNNTAMANAQGYGQFGASMAYGMQKADGGYIKKPRGYGVRGARLANGGDAWSAYKKANPVKSSSGNSGDGVNPAVAILSGAAPILVGAGLKSAMKSDFVKNNVTAPIKKAADEAWDGAKQAVGQAYDGAKQAVGQAYDSAKSGLAGEVASESAGQQALASATTTTDAMAATPDYSADFSKAFVGQGSGEVAGEVADQQAGEAVKDFAVQEIGSEVGQQVGQEIAESATKDLATMLAEAGVNSAFAHGGQVRGRRGLRLATGGLAGVMRMPSVSSLDASSSMKVSSAPVKVSMPSTAKSSGVAAQQQKMVGPEVSDAKTGYDVAEKANDAAAKTADATEKASTAATAATTAEAAAQAGDTANTINTAVDAAESANAATTAADAAASGSTSAVPYGSVVKAGADILSGEEAGTAVADAAASYAGAEAGAMAGSAVLPGVGTVVGGVVGGLLGGALFADGGDVEPTKRVDLKPGGDVQGPGTETSDSIPAWLSDGEIVENAEAVKLAGKDALLEINDAGLEVRDGKATPEEAQAKIGQAMIQRGNELTGGSRFMKRGVKLAGGGFLGGNLGVALGAGVDQYNIQSARSDQNKRFDKAYELQKENNDRLNRIAEQQAVEFENKQKDRKDTEALKANIIGIANKHQTIGKDADQYIAKETEANAQAAKEAGVEYQPMTPEQQAVIKQSVAKTPEQEYIDAFRGAGQIDAANALEGKRDLKEVGEKVAVATKDPVLQAIAKTNPLEAAKLHVGEVNLKERLEASERNQAARMQNALAVIEARNAGRAAGTGGGNKKDGTPANYIDRLVWTDKLNKDQPPEIADVAHSFYAQMYSEAMRKNGGVSDVDNSEMVRIANEAATAKTAPMLHYDAENMAYRYGFSDKGNNQRYLRFEASGDTLNTQTQKPFFDKKAKDVNEMESLKLWAKKDPELYRQAFTAASGGDQLDKMIRGREALESALKVGFADEATQRQAITQFGALDKAIRLAVILRNHPDWMENATKPAAKGSPSTSTWYSGDYPTNITNDEGSPNTIANGINATRNWFASQARKAQGSDEWGTQRKW